MHIEIDADLNMEDDEGRNIARLPAEHGHLHVGSVTVAGRPGAWSWVRIDEIDTSVGFVAFHQISAAEAARLAAEE